MESASYRDMLIDVAECIDDRTLERMKFRFANEIKARESEEIKTALKFFSALEKRGLLDVNKTDVLKDLLEKCASGKVDGLRIVQRYENRVGNDLINSVANPEVYNPVQQIIYINKNDVHQLQPTVRTQQTVDLAPEITYLSRSLGKDWKFFIRALGVLEDDIDVVVSDYSSTRERIYQCLLLWQLQEHQCACRQKLVETLRKDTVGRNDLALALESGVFH